MRDIGQTTPTSLERSHALVKAAIRCGLSDFLDGQRISVGEAMLSFPTDIAAGGC